MADSLATHILHATSQQASPQMAPSQPESCTSMSHGSGGHSVTLMQEPSLTPSLSYVSSRRQSYVALKSATDATVDDIADENESGGNKMGEGGLIEKSGSCRKMSEKALVNSSSNDAKDGVLAKEVMKVALVDCSAERAAMKRLPLRFLVKEQEDLFASAMAPANSLRSMSLALCGLLLSILVFVTINWLAATGRIDLRIRTQVVFNVVQGWIFLVFLILLFTAFHEWSLGHHEYFVSSLFSTVVLALTMAMCSIAYDSSAFGRTLGEALATLVWTDFLVVVCTTFVVLGLCVISRCRTRVMLPSTVFLCSCSLAFNVMSGMQILKVKNCSYIAAHELSCVATPVFLLICYLVLRSSVSPTVALLMIAARYHSEFLDRIDFLRYLTRSKQIRALQKTAIYPKISGTTAIEELLSWLLKARGLIQVAVTSQEGSALKDAESLIAWCLETLTKTHNFFAVKFRTAISDPLAAELREVLEMFAGESLATMDQYHTPSVAGLERLIASTRESVVASRELRRAARRIALMPKYRVPTLIFAPNSKLIEACRERAGWDWSFDVLTVEAEVPEVLYHVGLALLLPRLPVLGLATDPAVKFLAKINRLYLKNPYHNGTHGAMVGHSVLSLMGMLGLGKSLDTYESSLLEFTVAVAGLCHDVGHPGRNNAFFTNSGDVLALLYNDIAVLESYHSCILFFVLDEYEDCNVVGKMVEKVYRGFRKHVVELIMATDMSQHFEAVARFKTALRAEVDKPFDINEDENRWLVARMCMKAADVSHAMVGWNQHLEWSLRVSEEFYQQGQDEIALGLLVSPLCDRSAHYKFAQSQKGFLEFVVQPLLIELAALSPEINRNCSQALLYNIMRWDAYIATPGFDGKPVPEMSAEVLAMQTMSKRPAVLLTELFFGLDATDKF